MGDELEKKLNTLTIRCKVVVCLANLDMGADTLESNSIDSILGFRHGHEVRSGSGLRGSGVGSFAVRPLVVSAE